MSLHPQPTPDDEIEEAIESIADALRRRPKDHTTALAWKWARHSSTDALLIVAVKYFQLMARKRVRDETAKIERAAKRLRVYRTDSKEERRRKRELDAENQIRMATQVMPTLAYQLEQYALKMHVEWTEQLLASHFALADGTRVFWGMATVEEHQARVDMLMAHQKGTFQTIALHVAAIQQIREGGVQHLMDLLVV